MKSQFTRHAIITMATLSPCCGLTAAAQASACDATPPVELGKVAWGRGFEKAVAESKESGKPLMVLFDEVPGCGGCKTYGKVLLSHPLLVEA